VSLLERREQIARSLGRETWSAILSVTAIATGLALWLALGFPLLVLPVLLAGGFFILLTLHSPSVGLLAVVAVQYLPIEVGTVSVFQLVGSSVAVLSLISYGISRRGFVFPSVLLPILFFMFHALYSITFTHDAALTQYMVRKLVFNGVFCLLLANLIDDMKKLRGLLWTVVIMGIANSLAATSQFVGGRSIEARAQGLLENENGLGELAALSLVISLYFFFYADRRWKRAVGLGLCVLLGFGVIASISRGAVLSLLAGLAAVLLRESGKRLRLVFVAALALLALPYFPESFFHRFRNIAQDLRGTVTLSQRVGLTSRGYYNKAGIKIWKAHPVLGVGLGNYGSYYIRPEFNPGIRGRRTLPPHNIYIQALAETGVLGFTALCGWILLAVWDYLKAERTKLKEGAHRWPVRASETLTIVALVMYFSSGSLVYTNFAMVLTLGYICRRCMEKEQTSSLE